jgi:hypothetical protein
MRDQSIHTQLRKVSHSVIEKRIYPPLLSFSGPWLFSSVYSDLLSTATSITVTQLTSIKYDSFFNLLSKWVAAKLTFCFDPSNSPIYVSADGYKLDSITGYISHINICKAQLLITHICIHCR